MTKVSLGSLQKMGQNVRINFGSNAPKEDDFLYYFYHIPKCGGMDFYSSMQSTATKACEMRNANYIHGRCDEEEQFEWMLGNIANNMSLQSERVLGVFASHLGLPAFDHLLPNRKHTRKICFIREPFQRLVSDYCYVSMRENSSVSEDGLLAFMNKEENINKISRSLDYRLTDIESIWEFASSFYVMTTLDKMGDILGLLLYNHGLFNVVREPVNATLDKYRLKNIYENSKIIERFNGLNALDCELFDRVSANPIEPPVPTVTEISTVTSIIISKQQQEKYERKSYLLATLNLLKFVDAADQYSSMAKFMDDFRENQANLKGATV